MSGDSEGSYLSEWLDDSAEINQREYEREKERIRREQEKREKAKYNSIRRQLISDLISIGVIPNNKSADEYAQMLNGGPKTSVNAAASVKSPRSCVSETNLYKRAAAAKQGENIKCPACGLPFIKRSYNNIFCSNQKKRKGRSCKDDYHNGTRIA